MRAWRSAWAMRSAVLCWMKATRPTVTMANSPSTRLLRSIERRISGVFIGSFAHLEAALGLGVAVGARTGVVVDGRGGQVHQQHGEGHDVRVAAPGADQVDQNAH